MKAKLLFTVLISTLLLLLSGCGSNQNAQMKIRMGYFPNITHAPALVGLSQGFIQTELGNVALETKVFNAGPELMEAMAAGEIDVAYIGPGPALSGFARGVPLNIIAGANNAGAVLVAMPNSEISGVKDLAGKKVAIPQLGNTQDISLRHLLAQNGLKDKAKGGDVMIFQCAPADVLTMFIQGQVDAALVPEPWGAMLESKGGAKLVLDWNQIWHDGNYPTTVVIARRDYAEKNPAIIKAFLKAHKKSVEYIQQQQPGEINRIINSELKRLTKKEISLDILEVALSRTKATNDIETGIMQEYADLATEAGYLKTKVNVEQVINRSYWQGMEQ